MRAMGASPEDLAKWAERSAINAKAAKFPVLGENFDAVRLLMACATQWRRAGMAGVPLGLEYTGVEAAARMMDPPISPVPFEQIQILEEAALKVMIERHGKR